MKKFLFYGLMLMGAVCFFTSCDDDDDNGKGGDKKEPVSSFGGYFVQKAGDYKFTYDSQMRPVTFGYFDYEVSNLDYDKNQMIYPNGSEDVIYDLSFTREGYLSGIKSKTEEVYEGFNEITTLDGVIKYKNGKYMGGDIVMATNGTLMKATNEKSSDNIVCVWEGECLKKMEVKSVDIYHMNGEKVTRKRTCVYEFKYGNQPNKNRQYPISVLRTVNFFEDTFDRLALVGMCGDFSDRLPVSVHYISKVEGEPQDDYEKTVKFEYELDAKSGNIIKETLIEGVYVSESIYDYSHPQ